MLTFNKLKTEFFHLRLLSACLHFCWSSDSKTEPKCTFSFNKRTCDLNCAHSLMSMGLANARSEPKQPSLPEMSPLGVVFSKPVHAARVKTWPT